MGWEMTLPQALYGQPGYADEHEKNDAGEIGLQRNRRILVTDARESGACFVDLDDDRRWNLGNHRRHRPGDGGPRP